MSRLRVTLLALAAFLAAVVGAAIVAGAAPGDAATPGGAGTNAATFALDANNSVAIQPAETANGQQYASVDAGDELQIDFDALNRDGRTRADDVFLIDAESDMRLEVTVASDSEDVSFYWGSSPGADASRATVISANGATTVGVEVETNETVEDADFTVDVQRYVGGGFARPDADLVIRNPDAQWDVPHAGKPVELPIPLYNDANYAITRYVELWIDDETVLEREVTIPPGSERNVTFEHAFQAPGTYQIGVNGQRAGTVTVHSDTFEVTDANLSRAVVLQGESVTASATVTNHGTDAGTFRAELRVGGAVVEYETVHVPAGESVEVDFDRTFQHRGGYDVVVAGEDAGTVHVESRGGAAVRRYGAEHGPVLGVVAIPTIGLAIGFGRGRLGL